MLFCEPLICMLLSTTPRINAYRKAMLFIRQAWLVKSKKRAIT